MGAQSHFNDLCRLLDIEDPVSAGPQGGMVHLREGGEQDHRRGGLGGCLAQGLFRPGSTRGRRKDLDRAFAQLLQYAIALENPPLLIVSDTNSHSHPHELDQHGPARAMSSPSKTCGMRQIATRCVRPSPIRSNCAPARRARRLTEEAAENFARLALRLRAKGHAPDVVAHFVNRLVFCMFAEDVGLLQDRMFLKMLKACARNPKDFASYAATLFKAMQKGGMVGFERVAWFNGGLFDSDEAPGRLMPPILPIFWPQRRSTGPRSTPRFSAPCSSAGSIPTSAASSGRIIRIATRSCRLSGRSSSIP